MCTIYSLLFPIHPLTYIVYYALVMPTLPCQLFTVSFYFFLPLLTVACLLLIVSYYLLCPTSWILSCSILCLVYCLLSPIYHLLSPVGCFMSIMSKDTWYIGQSQTENLTVLWRSCYYWNQNVFTLILFFFVLMYK